MELVEVAEPVGRNLRRAPSLTIERDGLPGMADDFPDGAPLPFPDLVRRQELRPEQLPMLSKIGTSFPGRPGGTDRGANQEGVEIHATRSFPRFTPSPSAGSGA